MLASPRSWRLDVSTFRQRIDPIASWFWNAPHHIGRAAVALGHIAMIVVLVKQGALPLVEPAGSVVAAAVSLRSARVVLAVADVLAPAADAAGPAAGYLRSGRLITA